MQHQSDLKTYKVAYCGNVAEVADEIFLNSKFELKYIFCENEKVNEDIYFLCLLRDIKLIEVSSSIEINNSLDSLDNLDFLLMCGFGIILKTKLLSKIKVYNFHPGLLPNYKGRHPTFFATINNESNIYVSLHEVNAKIDDGPIIDIFKIPYRYKMTEIEVFKLIPKSVSKLLNSLELFLKRKIKIKKNNFGNYYPKVSRLDISFSSEDKPSKIINICRAQAKFKGGLFIFRGNEYWVRFISVKYNLFYDSVIGNVAFIKDLPAGIILNDKTVLKFNLIEKNLEE